MHRNAIIFLAVMFCLAVNISAADLYRVSIKSDNDATVLKATGVDPVMRISGGFLVLAEKEQGRAIQRSRLDFILISQNISRNELALDVRPRQLQARDFPVIYEDNGMILYRVPQKQALVAEERAALMPLQDIKPEIKYYPRRIFDKASARTDLDLTDLIAKVEYDTVYDYLHTLQAFNGRLSGTSNIYSARDWIKNKFMSFGYTDVTLDNFTGYQLYSYNPVSAYNVVARKTGTVYPNRQIVIGAHFDAVPNSPGADDNGSGSIGVLEIARALADVETEMTFVFITFDSEESGLHGAWHYAGNAAYAGDSIVCMLNMDMIGFQSNSTQADLVYGAETGYAELWGELSDPLVNIEGILGGTASNSDHYAFDQNGYDVVFAAEYYFSSVYHTYRDSTSYINFDYMTRMIKATLATAYTIDRAPLPVNLLSIYDAGDGQALQVNWTSENPSNLDHFIVYYDTYPVPGALDSVTVSANETSYMLQGLTTGQQYRVYITAVDAAGHRSILSETAEASPNIRPAIPGNFASLPLYRGIELFWKGNNTELDFSHFAIIRDGSVLPGSVTDTFYVDDDFQLGADVHQYLIVAVDDDGNISDTVGAEPISGKAAMLNPGSILLVNRSNRGSPYLVDETITGEFMRDALSGYDYDYYSDTAWGSINNIKLFDMIDYEVMVLGGEAARVDDFGGDPSLGGILDSIAYFMSIGGKVVIFGRWGNFRVGEDLADTVDFNPGAHDYAYQSVFHMDKRIKYLSEINSGLVTSDLIGAHSQATGYPDLVWDSAASLAHTVPVAEVQGVPCPTFAVLGSADPEIIYTYDSRSNFPYTEGRPVGWRYLGSDYEYIFFELPLSFIERSGANAALQMAVSELISTGPGGFAAIDPDTLDIPGTHPATISIYLGDFMPGATASDVDAASIIVNGSVAPSGTSVIGSYPPFVGDVLQIDVAFDDLAATYTGSRDTSETIFVVSWQFSGNEFRHFANGPVMVIGESYVEGDANGDGSVNVGDAVFIINYVFKGGAAPEPYNAGDANCDGAVNVGDAVFIINFVFKGGQPPGC